MTTDRTQIEATLRQLQAQLSESTDIDPDVRSRLLEIEREILGSLKTPELRSSGLPAAGTVNVEPLPHPDESGATSLTRRLADAALYFEESHPSLSTTIGSLAGILGQMGL